MRCRRKQLIYHLNTSGKYVAFKEQLKYAVVKIVRDKYLRTVNFSDNCELQANCDKLINSFARILLTVDNIHISHRYDLSLATKC